MSSPGSVAGLRVSDAGERALIDRIRRRLPSAPPELVVGIGDDAAVTAPDRGAFQALTTDAFVEGIHFDRRFSAPADIGAKALAVNISDIAAMGAAPRFALLSLLLPPDLAVDDLDSMVGGLLDTASRYGVVLAGGNLSRSPGPLVIDITLSGSVRPRRILTRGGGRPGDALYVSGEIGAGLAGLEWLRAHAGDPGAPPDGIAACVARYRRPEPRARLGALLGRNRAATACMDTSDGLADAITQVCDTSGTGAEIDAAALPIHPAARAWFADRDPVASALAGGDDYELVFAVARRQGGRLRAVVREARGLAVTRIGELTADPAILLRRNGHSEPLPAGYTHF